MHVRFIAAAAILLCGTAPALGEDGIVAAAATTEDTPEIVVTGQRQEYGVKSTRSATKTNADIKSIPQALTVVTQAQIEDQQLRSIADVLTFVPGATPGTGEANRDQMTLRGNNTTADFFVDGIRDDVQYFRDLYNVDRVEVLRGSNAMIFGRGGGGGVVNRVLKRSSLGTTRRFSASGDREGGFRLTGDVDQALGSGAGLRINGMYENGESFRRHVDLKRYGVNPAVAFMAGPNTRIDLSYEFLHDRRTTDRGVPSDARAGAATRLNPVGPLEGYDRIFFGDPNGSYSDADVHIASLGLEHQLVSGLTLRNRTLYGDYYKFYQNVFPNSAVTAAETVRLSAYNDSTDRKNLFSQTDLVWDNRVGGLDQTLLLGVELGRQKGNNQRRNGIFADSSTAPTFINVPLADPTVDLKALSFLPPSANNDMNANIAAIYVQDQLRPTDWLEIVAGLRFDRLWMEIDNEVSGQSFGRTDRLWSPRIGFVLKPSASLSVYTSYSRSYLPQSGDQFNSLAANTQTLKPERFDNIEAGLKWEPVQGLLATAAVYRLDRSNTRLNDPAQPTQFVLSGKQRSRGVELGLERSVMHNWQVSAGYAWQKAEVTEATAACLTADCEVPLVPRHSFSLWNRYNVTDQLGLGLGVIARSKSFASISNAVILPSYTRVDAAAYYKIAKGLRAQVNVENLFGGDYFPTAHNDNNIAPGAPRTIRATLKFGI